MSIARMEKKSPGDRVRKTDRNMMTRELLALGWKTTRVDYLSAPPMLATKIGLTVIRVWSHGFPKHEVHNPGSHRHHNCRETQSL